MNHLVKFLLHSEATVQFSIFNYELQNNFDQL